MIVVISLLLATIAAFIAYKTYRHQQGELIISFVNLPLVKSFKDDVFEDNIRDIRLKIT